MKKIVEIIMLIMFFIFLAFLAVIFNDYEKVFLNIFMLIFFPYITIVLMNCASSILRWLDERDIKKSKYPKNGKLYYWMSHADLDRKYFYEITNRPSNRNLFENLKELRKQLRREIGSNIGDYYLLNEYLETKERNSLLSNFSKILMNSTIAIVIGVFVKIFSNDEFLNKILSIINFELDLTPSLIATYLNYSTYFLIFATLALYIYGEITKEKRRIQVLLAVVKSIIQDIEDK
ncbi:hypothetical protein ACTWP4_18730 [Gracilibacillus sp. D59]|uniref:hypothetical protein n=1 Tax=Gracilibacillus sp. D59 TaxID=3457434 RepID=UPI003FCEACEA